MPHRCGLHAHKQPMCATADIGRASRPRFVCPTWRHTKDTTTKVRWRSALPLRNRFRGSPARANTPSSEWPGGSGAVRPRTPERPRARSRTWQRPARRPLCPSAPEAPVVCMASGWLDGDVPNARSSAPGCDCPHTPSGAQREPMHVHRTAPRACSRQTPLCGQPEQCRHP